MLDEWKKEVSFDKKYFPSLLERLVNTQEQTMKKKNLQSVFRACGICSLDCNEPSEITNPRYFYQWKQLIAKWNFDWPFKEELWLW